jgi:hypothetical protein
VIGMLGGHVVADKIAGPQLQKIFSAALIITALITLGDQLAKEGF